MSMPANHRSVPSNVRQPQDHQPPRPRRLVNFPQAGAYFGASSRTVRNWVTEGYFPAYRVPGVRGVMVDLDEIEAALRRLPRGTVRAGGFGSFGPKAIIIDLPAQAEVASASEPAR